MKAIPYFPTTLLLFLCLLNLYLGIIDTPDQGFDMYLLFGVVYLSLGLLFIRKIRFAELLGFIASFVLLFIYPMIVDFHNLQPWTSGIMGALNATVIVSCLFLLLIKVKS